MARDSGGFDWSVMGQRERDLPSLGGLALSLVYLSVCQSCAAADCWL